MRHLEDKHERIDYESFQQIMGNARAWFSDDDIVAIGAEGIGSPLVKSFITIGRMLMTPVGFYRWMLSAGGLGNQMFTNVVPTFREVEPGHFVVELRTSPGYVPNREFLLMSRGGMQAVSEVLGLGKTARVDMSWTDTGARYEIRVPVERSARARLIKLLTFPFNARNAATELEDAMRALEARYADLETARATLERQRSTLDTAYRLGRAIWGEREPGAIATTIVTALIATELVEGARFSAEGADFPTVAEAGIVGTTRDAIAIALAGRQMRGKLEGWSAEGSDAAQVRELLELLAPTIALAVDNSFAYHELEAYQKDLEKLVHDRTAELRLARDELSATVAQLRDAQEARERIFANISHEIRTPLSLILLAVADVEARGGALLDPIARADLTSVVESARKLLRLVDELLLLAAGREMELKVTPQPTEVASLIAALTVTWRPAAEAAGLRLGYDGPESLVAMVDPIALERIVTNLLSNAVKFTPRGGRVSVALSREHNGISLTVRDTGIGIDDDLKRRLFGRFERGRASGAGRGGSGIGLSLVKELVEAHGGTVTVERLEAGGTEFHVHVPAAESAAPVETAAPRLRPGDYGLGAGSPVSSGDVFANPHALATIVVAEDDPRLASMIARLLADEYTVVVGLDGLAALDLVRQHQPHLLITDVDMPGMDGVELTRRFRQIIDNRLAPVLILSAAADPTTRLAGLDAGAVDYVVKPFDPAELKARVRSQLRMRELALRLHRAEQLSALGTLSSGLAHELRNPANGIVNAVGPLKKLLPEELRGPNSGVGQLVAVLGSCADQIAFLSRQLLSFKRGGDLELRTVPLGDIVERALTLAQPALRDVSVREHVADQKPVRCAPPLLVQVLTNLVENAAHAAGAGGWVEIASVENNGKLTVEVADSGPGVPIELRERVFEPFFTTKPPGVGTGLGLPLARDIVHRHGGVLEIRERDQRSVFVVELPNPPS